MSIFSIEQTRASMDLFLSPNANGCNIELTPVGAPNNWECVDDNSTTPDDDSTYNYSNAVALKYDLYSLTNHTTETGTINYVQVFSRAKSHLYAQHEDGEYKIILTDDACANIYKSNDINLTTGYLSYSSVWTQNPRTTAAWTWNDVDNLQIGSECSSPTLLNQTEDMVLYPNGDGGQCGTIPPINTYDGDPTHNWMTQNNIPPSGYGIYIDAYEVPPFIVGTWYCDHYTMENHTALGTEPINYVYVRIYAREWSAGVNHKARTLLVSGGNDYYGDEVVLTSNWVYVTTKYLVNPDTSIAWTWADINSVLCGSSLKLGDALAYTECTRTELIVNYDVDINPEIRTTQNYAKINYTPPAIECTLNKPEVVSVDHSMNIKMLNFWNGTREVYSLNRSGKSMVLTGSEYQSDTCDKECPCERITCMKEMGKDGSTITISGLRSLFNGEFKIRSFGWKHISEKPEYYEWILELEYDD